jgi:hypothetical protein
MFGKVKELLMYFYVICMNKHVGITNRKLNINKIFVCLGHINLSISSLDWLAPLFPECIFFFKLPPRTSKMLKNRLRFSMETNLSCLNKKKKKCLVKLKNCSCIFMSSAWTNTWGSLCQCFCLDNHTGGGVKIAMFVQSIFYLAYFSCDLILIEHRNKNQIRHWIDVLEIVMNIKKKQNKSVQTAF